MAVFDGLLRRVSNLEVGRREVDPEQYEHTCAQTTGDNGQGNGQVVQLAGENLHAAVLSSPLCDRPPFRRSSRIGQVGSPIFDEQDPGGARAANPRPTFPLPAGPLGPLQNPVNPGAMAYIPAERKMVKRSDRLSCRPRARRESGCTQSDSSGPSLHGSSAWPEPRRSPREAARRDRRCRR